MGTQALIWALVFDRHYDLNPIAQNELGRVARRSTAAWRSRILAALVAGVLVGIGLISVLRSAAILRDFAVIANVILNLFWTVPVSGVAAYAIQRERTRLTLDLLLLTPFTTKSILLAKAAGSFARISNGVIGGLLLLSGLGSIAIIFLIPLATVSSQNTFSWMLFGAFIIGLMYIERLQELALSASLGLFLGSTATSPDMVILLNFIVNMAVRVVQLLVVVLFAEAGGIIRGSTTLAWLNLLMGTSSVLVYSPTWVNLGVVALVIGAREGVIRLLLSYSVRRVPRGIAVR